MGIGWKSLCRFVYRALLCDSNKYTLLIPAPKRYTDTLQCIHSTDICENCDKIDFLIIKLILGPPPRARRGVPARTGEMYVVVEYHQGYEPGRVIPIP